MYDDVTKACNLSPLLPQDSALATPGEVLDRLTNDLQITHHGIERFVVSLKLFEGQIASVAQDLVTARTDVFQKETVVMRHRGPLAPHRAGGVV